MALIDLVDARERMEAAIEVAEEAIKQRTPSTLILVLAYPDGSLQVINATADSEASDFETLGALVAAQFQIMTGEGDYGDD